MTVRLNLTTDSATALHSDAFEKSYFDELLYTVFQAPRDPGLGGVVIAISSCDRGEGGTFIARAILNELDRCHHSSVAGLKVSFLRKLHEPTLEAIRTSLRASEHDAQPEGKALASRRRNALMTEPMQGPWEGSWQYRRDCIDLLRSEFDYSIIDCPAMSASGDLLSIARFVDGVLLVVEANRTRRERPRQAEQRIAAAGGKLLGIILNKYRCEVPAWIDHLL